MAGALVQWLKLPAWEVGHHGFESHSGLQVSKQNVSSPLTRKDSILWGSSVTGGSVPGLEFRVLCLECHLIYITILRILSWPSKAYMCTKVDQNPFYFILFHLYGSESHPSQVMINSLSILDDAAPFYFVKKRCVFKYQRSQRVRHCDVSHRTR